MACGRHQPVSQPVVVVVAKEQTGMVSGAVTTLAAIGAGVGTAALGVLYRNPVDAQGAADGASAVLFASSALALATTAVVLVLIRSAELTRAIK